MLRKEKKAASYEILRESETKQDSEVFGEISGTFCTLWSREVLTKFQKGNFCI